MSGVVWPVSIGQYSDYRVVMVCETEEEARRVADHLNGNKRSPYSDDYEVDDPIPLRSAGDPLPEKVTVWRCVVYDDDRAVSHNTSEKWAHEVHPGGNRFDNGGVGYDWSTREEAERVARQWQKIR